MSSRRTAILIGAIAIGIVAVVLIWQYVRGIENNMYEESQPVSVFIATKDIPRGTGGETAVMDKSIDQAQVPQKYKPQTAITSQDAVSKKVALFNIAPGTIVVNGMFVDPATTQISFRERLKNKNHVAISVQVDQVKGVGGFLVPGDEVNMLVMVKMNESRKQTVDAGAAGGAAGTANTGVVIDEQARYLYQKVQILAVGQTQLLSPGEQATTGKESSSASAGAGSGLLTFNVPPEAAQLIASVQDKGLYLTLVPKDYTPKALGPLPDVMNMLPGEDPGKLCPYYDTAAGEAGCATAAG